MEKEKEPVKRAYTRPELVKFGRADRLTTQLGDQLVPSGGFPDLGDT